MNHVQRFHGVMSFQPVDRLPAIEWAPWWNQTLDRWYAEGLPRELTGWGEIGDYFGLDRHGRFVVGAWGEGCPRPAHHGAGIVADASDYGRVKPYLYRRSAESISGWEGGGALAAGQRAGDTVVWLTLRGFFWHPRTLLGIQRHLLSFYDQPELMEAMNRDLVEYQLWAIEEVCRVCTPDFVTFAEDMSYNHGPMLSQAMFDEFIAPHYRVIIPELERRGIIPLVDSDGDVMPLIPWLEGVGVQGILPLERMAGVDVSLIRQRHPRFLMVGAFDKTVMHRGEAAIRAEFERLLPAMRGGGFIASCDHQTPPEVSLDDYRLYVSLLKEYCVTACGAA